MRNYPWYKGWEKKFDGEDFTILGIHTPETSAEREPANVRANVKEVGFSFPVLIDTGKKTWNSWGNSMWPSVYLIDKQGRIRYWWFGELDWNQAGGQKLLEQRIRELLDEDG